MRVQQKRPMNREEFEMAMKKARLREILRFTGIRINRVVNNVDAKILVEILYTHPEWRERLRNEMRHLDRNERLPYIWNGMGLRV